MGVASKSMGLVESFEFRLFTKAMRLVDTQLVGRSFTMYHSNGIVMSMFDRVLVSTRWRRVGHKNLSAISWVVSDHCMIVLKYVYHL